LHRAKAASSSAYCNPFNKIVIKQVRLMARNAHTYICTYSPCTNLVRCRKPQQNRIAARQQKLLFKAIDSLVKQFCSHHCTFDFDRGFLSSLLCVKEEEDNNMKRSLYPNSSNDALNDALNYRSIDRSISNDNYLEDYIG